MVGWGGGVWVPQGTVASGMGQAASLCFLHPWRGMSRAALGVASMELQPWLCPRRCQRCPQGHSSVPIPPLCPDQCCHGLQRYQDGAGGVLTPFSPPPPTQEPVLLPSLLGNAVSSRVGAGAGSGSGVSSSKRELESVGLITAGNRSLEPSELLIPLGSFHCWLLSRAVPAALVWEGAEPILASRGDGDIPALCGHWGLCRPQILSPWQGHQYPRDAKSTHNPPPPFSPDIRDHHHQCPIDRQPRISPTRL